MNEQHSQAAADGTDRQLIVEVLRHLRAEGWKQVGNYDSPWWSKKGVYRVFIDYDGEGHTSLRVDDKIAKVCLIDGYWPRSVREAVYVLAALGVLPPRFSSAHAAGRTAAPAGGAE